MRIAIMQPYFFPYLGYISLIKHTDQFILFDTVQFIRHGWIERNRVLKPDEGWQYIQVPLHKFSRDTLIKDVKINNTSNWSKKILAQIAHYKKKAPFYYKTVEVLQGIFNESYDDMVSFNSVALKEVCNYLEIDIHIDVFSQMELLIKQVNAPDEWALNICKELGNVSEYWNPPGGQDFFDKKKYDNANIDLKFHSLNLSEYNQKNNEFVSGLSIIDVMMFNSKEEINKMLDNYMLL